MDRLTDALRRLERFSRERNYAGPDPYDGLLSPLAQRLTSKRSRQALVQLVKRSTIDLRPVLGIPPVRMTKALALFSSGYARSSDHVWRDRGRQLAEEIVDRVGPDAWGYEFDVQTRWGYYRADSPNIIATAFALEALRDYDLLNPVADRVRTWLEREMITADGAFRYVPGNDRLIHNANLLGARAYQRVGGSTETVRQAVKVTLAGQRDDGLWPYGVGDNLTWVDGFHTVYVLDCLADLSPIADVGDALETGVRAWREHLFEGGEPLYSLGSVSPVDGHNLATTAYGLARLEGADVPGNLSWLLRHQNDDGGFSIGRRPSFERWNNAHAFRALSEWTRADG